MPIHTYVYTHIYIYTCDREVRLLNSFVPLRHENSVVLYPEDTYALHMWLGSVPGHLIRDVAEC